MNRLELHWLELKFVVLGNNQERRPREKGEGLLIQVSSLSHGE